jgi:hypothetical protein
MRKIIMLLSVSFACFTVLASGSTLVKGVVFIDRNGDGMLQRSEKRLKNILVSNGDTIVETNKYGEYYLYVNAGGSVFPILPGTYRFAGNGIPSGHFRYITSSSGQEVSNNFALTKVHNPTCFQAAIVGDVQVKDMEELHFAERTVFSELVNTKNKDFALFMGDLSNDNDSVLLLMHDVINALPLQSWCLAGNHDMDMSKPRTSALFRKFFGSDVYAFFRGNACFIILNNNYGFEGSIPEPQMRFLKQLIRLLPAEVLPVVCQHVPLYSVSNRADFLAAIGQRRCLVLSGHAHNVSRHIWNQWVNEWVVGASCGSWWVGERDYSGIPLALQQCGSPRNYFTFEMNGADYSLRFKGIGLDPDLQADIWVKGQDGLDDSIPALAKLPENFVVVNLFAGGDSTKVEISIDGAVWQKMEHTQMVAPAISRIIEWNKQKMYPTTYSKRIPLRSRPSPHIWTYQMPRSEKGLHTLRIRAWDRYGLPLTEQSRSFYTLFH